MNKPLPDWVLLLLLRPRWQIVLGQWLIIALLMVMLNTLLFSNMWKQREQAQQQQQQLIFDISKLQKKLAQLPTLALLEQRAKQHQEQQQQSAINLTELLQQSGSTLLRWQRQNHSQQYTLKLLSDYPSLLKLLAALPPVKRIHAIHVTAQADGLIAQLSLQSTRRENNE